MKKILYSGVALAVALFWGCESFLEEKSLDEFRPGTVTELQRIMYGEAYPLEQADQFTQFLDLLTDDVQSNYPGNNPVALGILDQGAPVFTWNYYMFDHMADKRSEGAAVYERLYEKIMGCNVVLDYVDDMVGSQAERDNMKGQMLALRSYYYLMLVNLFAAPYNDTRIDVETAPGVVLVLTSATRDEYPPRHTIAQVYRRIEEDLLASIPMLEANGQANRYYQATPLFPVLLLSRMYLYQERWDLALEYAQKVIDRKPTLTNFNDYYREDGDGAYNLTAGIFGIGSPEVIWAYTRGSGQGNGLGNYYNRSGAAIELPQYQISSEMWALYKKGEYDGMYFASYDTKDIRGSVYISMYYGTAPTWSLYPLSSKKQQQDVSPDIAFSRGLRNVEAYLIRAEVNAEKFAATGDTEYRRQALEDINHILLNRWNTNKSEFEPIVAETAGEVVQAVRDERRRELVFEDHRWFDLRRYGMPELTHTFKATQEGSPQTYVLSEGDARYVLPIPSSVLERNPSLRQNEYPQQ